MVVAANARPAPSAGGCYKMVDRTAKARGADEVPFRGSCLAANARPAHPRAVATRWSIAAAKAPRADKVAFRGHTWLRTLDRPILGRLLPDGRSHGEGSRSRQSGLRGVMLGPRTLDRPIRGRLPQHGRSLPPRLDGRQPERPEGRQPERVPCGEKSRSRCRRGRRSARVFRSCGPPGCGGRCRSASASPGFRWWRRGGSSARP